MNAFNQARRAEEQQLGLAANTLGNLVLPSQAVWSAMSDDAKALFLINAERTARNNMRAGVLGLPYAGVERHVDDVSRDYAQLLHDLSKTGHYQPSNDPNVDNPSKRLDNGVGASCREFLSRSENLAYFSVSSSQPIGASSIPLPLERAIYAWIYDDSTSQWGHREAVLLQDTTLTNNPWGYKNNNGSAAHEGFLGFHVLGSTSYKPFGEPPANMPYSYGVAVVMNIYDPLSDAAALSNSCGYDVTVRIEDLPTTTPSNQVPKAVADNATAAYGQAVSINVLSNDSDPDGDTLTVQSFTNPTHGTVSKDAQNVLTYTPTAGFSGADSFTYTISDGNGHTSVATVNLTVSAPLNRAPTAVADTATTAYGTQVSIQVLSNDTDPDNDLLTLIDSTNGTHGTVSFSDSAISYKPNADFSGEDSFSYTISDGHGHTAIGQVKVTVGAAPNRAPTAVTDTVTTAYNTALTINAVSNDTDPENDTLTITANTQPSHGTVSRSGNVFTYTPTTGYSGADSFTYTISDGKGNSATGIVNITVGAAPNRAPTAVTDTVTTAYNTVLTINALSNDTDPENDTLTVTANTQPSHGTVSRAGNVFTYTPTTGYSGADSFTYTISDGKGNSATGIVNISVGAAPNRAPTAVTDTVTTAYNTILTINALSNDTDPENDTLTITANTQPSHGTVSRAGNVFTYTPTTGYSGADSFTYTISDGKGNSATGIVNISVGAAPNRAPTAVTDTVTTAYNTALTLNAVSNDTDPENDTLTITANTQPSHGTVSRVGNVFTYTPTTGYSGADSFTYTISDGKGNSATGIVNISVGAAPNRAPTAVTDTVTTAYNTALTINAVSNDTDPENDTLTVTANTQPSHGTVSRAGNVFTYTPATGYSGADSFTYTISDGKGNSATGIVNISVGAAPVDNKAPIAVNDTINTTMGVPVLVNLLANDSDPNGDKIALKALTNPKNGKLYWMNNSYIFYFPNAGFVGKDSFTYTITDSKGATSTASVAITVASANKLPIAKNDVVTAKSGKAVTLNVLTNDSDPDGDALTVLGATVPSHGSIRWQDKKTMIYTPRADYTGWDNFVYTISDGRGGSALAFVSVWVSK
jgi:ribosomal protein S30